MHGDLNVPHRGYDKVPALGDWVQRQRKEYKCLQEGKTAYITKARIATLNAIGFPWNQLEATWEQRLSELHRYKLQHGDCNVPKRYKPNLMLACWVATQRHHYRMLQEGKPSAMTESINTTRASRAHTIISSRTHGEYDTIGSLI